MELRQIACIVAVAEELHFGRAAERLRIPQPSLSRQVRQLERELGVRLFERTSRRVELTAAGAAFVQMAPRVLGAVDAAQAAALAAAAGTVGRVSLGFVSSAAIRAIPEIMALQRRRIPGIEVSLSEMNSAAQVEALRAGTIDVGIVRDVPDLPGLQSELLFREPLYAAVPVGHPLLSAVSSVTASPDAGTPGEDTRIDVLDLVRYDCVMLPTGAAPKIRGLLERAAHTIGRELHRVQEARQYATLLALVAASVGVAVVPGSVRTLRQQGVEYRRLHEGSAEAAWSEVCAVIRHEESSPSARAIHAIARQAFSGDRITPPPRITPV